jgi:hypothetical protein
MKISTTTGLHDVLGVLVARPPLAARRGEKCLQHPLALSVGDLLVVVAELGPGGQQIDPRFDQRAQSRHVLVDRRVVGVVEDVECGHNTGARLGELEIADRELHAVGCPHAELGTHVAQRSRQEHVLDQPAQVVVDVDPKRVRLLAIPVELDDHADPVIERLVVLQCCRGRPTGSDSARPDRLAKAVCREAVRGRPCALALGADADAAQRPQRCQCLRGPKRLDCRHQICSEPLPDLSVDDPPDVQRTE